MGPMKSGTSSAQRLTALVAAIAVALVCVAPVVTASLRAEEEFAAAAQFSAFKQQYGKAYATLEEEAHRLRVFKENMEDAMVMNAANPYATFGVTQFSDLTREEFRMRYANSASHLEAAQRDAKPTVNVTGTAPFSVNWRERGAVTPVKAQKDCGACWAFATIGAIESQVKIAGGQLRRLSEQHLVSCDTLDNACKGGLMGKALTYIVEQNNGIVYTEDSWPYASADGTVPPCNMKGRDVGAKVAGHERLSKDENEIAAYLAEHGPVTIAIDASSLHQYKGGLVTECKSTRVGHAVLLVGYEDRILNPRWIIKNSWGTTWGEEGYLRINKGSNTCLMTTYVVAALLAKEAS